MFIIIIIIIIIIENTPVQDESLLHSLAQAARGIGLYMNSDKTELMCISSSNGKPLKFANQFIHIGSNILSTESNVNISTGKAWTALGRLTTIWKSDLSDKIKWEFFQVMVVSVLLYGCIHSDSNDMPGEKAGWEPIQRYGALF